MIKQNLLKGLLKSPEIQWYLERTEFMLKLIDELGQHVFDHLKLITSRDNEMLVLAVSDPEGESGLMVEHYALWLVLSWSRGIIHLHYLRLVAECVGR